jgi:hypothetical protein
MRRGTTAMKRKLLLLCFTATGLLAAQDALFPAARTVSDVPPPIIKGTIADGTLPPTPPAAITAPAPAVLRSVRTTVERVHPAAGLAGNPDTAKVRATLQFIAKPPVPPTPIPLVEPPKPAVPSTGLSPALRAALAARKPFTAVFVSATVYPGPRTKLQWWISGLKSGPFTAWSNINFHHLTGFDSFSWQEHDYSLLMCVGSAPDPAHRPASAKPLPALEIPVLPADRPAFILTAGNANTTASLAPMEALHLLYQNEAPRLTAAHEGRERARQARAEWLRLHPPQPQDITIRCWTSPPPRRTAAPAVETTDREGGTEP